MEDTLDLVKKCLTLISRIAARGARSPDSEHVHDTLFELGYVLTPLGPRFDVFTDKEPNHKPALLRLHDDLDFIDSTSEPLTAELVLKYSARSTWN